MIESNNEKVEKELLEGFRPFLDKGADQDKISLICKCQAKFLPQSPVNVLEVAANVGLRVFEASLAEGVSGMLDCRERKIYLERTDSGRRKRFTCAHEIGHFLLHDNNAVVLLRSPRPSEIEREANSMAAEILMPKYYVKEFVNEHGEDPGNLAERFKVSNDAATYRIMNVIKSRKA